MSFGQGPCRECLLHTSDYWLMAGLFALLRACGCAPHVSLLPPIPSWVLPLYSFCLRLELAQGPRLPRAKASILPVQLGLVLLLPASCYLIAGESEEAFPGLCSCAGRSDKREPPWLQGAQHLHPRSCILTEGSVRGEWES